MFAPVSDTATVFTSEKRTEISVIANLSCNSVIIFYLHNAGTILLTSGNRWQLCLPGKVVNSGSKDKQFVHS